MMRWLAAAALAGTLLLDSAPEPPCSPCTLAVDAREQHLFIADATGKRVLVWSLQEGKVTSSVALPDPPSGIAVAPDGRTLYVTGAAPEGRVHVIDVVAGGLRRSFPAGHMPCAPVLTPDGKTLYVCNRFADRVSIRETATGRELGSVPIPRQPIAAALTPDGGLLLVANHLPAGRADGSYAGAEVTVITTRGGRVASRINLPNGATGVRDLCLSPDGRHAFVTHILARYHVPTNRVERGWINTNALSILDVKAGTLHATVLLDDISLGAANPWGVACFPDGKTLVVSHAGSQELSLIDLPGLLERLARLADAARGRLTEELGFLGSLRRRVPVAGNGPRGVVVAGGRVFAAEYFSGSLAEVSAPGSARSHPLAARTPPTPERRGEIFFNDASACFQRWHSCASCHPDARNDALNWDLLNDGVGNPRSTKSMLLAHATPPAMITGVRPHAEAAVRAGIRSITFAKRPESEARAIDTYLTSLRPVPSPHLLNGKPNEAARRGAAAFEKAQCNHCHPAPLYTDLKKHPVGTGRGPEKDRAFDTPTLVELWRTAPYLYDGRAADLRSLLTTHNKADRHGRTAGLSEGELRDLVAFLLSL